MNTIHPIQPDEEAVRVKQPKYTLYKIFDKCGFILYLGRIPGEYEHRG